MIVPCCSNQFVQLLYNAERDDEICCGVHLPPISSYASREAIYHFDDPVYDLLQRFLAQERSLEPSAYVGNT